MRSLVSLRAIKSPPTVQGLLDIALVLALLPHLFTLKAPMLLFLLLSGLMLYKTEISKAAIYAFMLLGLVAIGLSFYAQYNFAALSRMLVFVSMVISLLVYAVALQRMSRSINFYLLISPALLFILAFFFFNTITMLFYALFTLFIFLLLIVWHRMQSPLHEALKTSAMLFALALPVVVVLFLVFPRVSFQKTTFGFKGDEIARTGHDGTMHLDSKALLVPSQKIVMEVLFDAQIPRDSQLYFRGSVLYKDNVTTWEALPPFKEDTRDLRRLLDPKEIVSYHVTLYPHHKKWLYLLDMPVKIPPKSRLDSNFIVTSELSVTETLRYNTASALSYATVAQGSDAYMRHALTTDADRDPRSADAVKAIKLSTLDDTQKAQQLVNVFRSQQLTYSLRPDLLDLDHPTDSFLFDTKKGYCVHFAASFANLARLAGIPSRIVTGYKADRKNMVNNYLVVRESDAHAWVELYLEPSGWVRFEPTALAAANDLNEEESLNVLINNIDPNVELTQIQKIWQQSNLYFMYSKFIIENWILKYSRLKQMQLLKELLQNTLFLAKFVGAFLLMTFLSILAFVLLQKKGCDDETLCALEPLFKKLAKEGLFKEPAETMQHFLQRVADTDTDTEHSGMIAVINTLYHRAKYSAEGDESTIGELKEAVEQFRKA